MLIPPRPGLNWKPAPGRNHDPDNRPCACARRGQRHGLHLFPSPSEQGQQLEATPAIGAAVLECRSAAPLKLMPLSIAAADVAAIVAAFLATRSFTISGASIRGALAVHGVQRHFGCVRPPCKTARCPRAANTHAVRPWLIVASTYPLLMGSKAGSKFLPAPGHFNA